jgi:hypothetical protein
MARYGGADIKAFAEAIKGNAPSGIRDWSIDLAYHLAMALISLRKLQEHEIQTTYRRKRLIEPALEDAWRQMVFIRQRYIPDQFALNDIIRQVTLSKTGKVMIDEENHPNKDGRRDGESGTESSPRQRTYRRANQKRYRRRIIRKPTSD